MSKPLNEKEEFSLRLKKALKRSPKKVETPTQLALQFNLRWNGEPISQQAAQKWLTGLARPTVDKIEVLAEWLNVSAQWLRLGIAEERPQSELGKKDAKGKIISLVTPTEDELALVDQLRNLSEHRRLLVLEIVEQFSLEQQIWR
jgi:transcriptional regulator with XRE-family HTH domain